MRTLTLSRNLSLQETYDRLLDMMTAPTRSSASPHNPPTVDYVTPMYCSVTGLFMLDKAVCVRTDARDKIEYGFHATPEGLPTRGSKEHEEFLNEKIRLNIKKWYDKGKGEAMIHMRSYPRTGQHRGNPRGRRESFPHRCDDGSYFFHLGGYGSTRIWEIVQLARRTRKPLPKAIYKHISDAIDVLGEEWTHRIKGDHLYRPEGCPEDEATTRSYTLMWWKDGRITDTYTTDSECGIAHREFNVTSLEDYDG